MIAVDEFPSTLAETLVGALDHRPDLVVQVLRTINTREAAAEVMIALGNEVAEWHSSTYGSDTPLLGMAWGKRIWPIEDPGMIPLANTALSYTHAGDREGVLAATRTPSLATISRTIVLLARCVRQLRT